MRNDYHTSTVEGAAGFEACRADRCDDRYEHYEYGDDSPELEHEEAKTIRISIHRARKDHCKRNGFVLVHKGRKYRLVVKRCTRRVREDEDSEWQYSRWIQVAKVELAQD